MVGRAAQASDNKTFFRHRGHMSSSLCCTVCHLWGVLPFLASTRDRNKVRKHTHLPTKHDNHVGNFADKSVQGVLHRALQTSVTSWN